MTPRIAPTNPVMAGNALTPNPLSREERGTYNPFPKRGKGWDGGEMGLDQYFVGRDAPGAPLLIVFPFAATLSALGGS